MRTIQSNGVKHRVLWLTLVLLGVGIGGCGSDATSSGLAMRSSQVNDSSGSVVAYFVGFQSFGQALMYLPTDDLYVRVDLETGLYTATSVSYSGAGCTGTAFLTGGTSAAWYGPLGKAVVYDGSKYYKVTGSGLSNTASSNNGVNNTGTSTSCVDFAPQAVTGGYSITEITRPYDFTAIAPLSITYSQ